MKLIWYSEYYHVHCDTMICSSLLFRGCIDYKSLLSLQNIVIGVIKEKDIRNVYFEFNYNNYIILIDSNS